MENITLNLDGSFISKQEMENIKSEIIAAHELLLNREGVSSDMTGWIDYVDRIGDEYEEIMSAKEYIKDKCEAFIVLGIGGSYLGAKAAIEAIRGDFHNEIEKPAVYFAGQNLSGSYLKKLKEVVSNKEICLIVISKSGTTIETALSFRVLKELMEEKYMDESKKRIFVVTDKNRGALKKISDLNGYKTFVIPDDIGGRYSVITPVGLLPMAFANLNVQEFLNGLKSGAEEYKNSCFDENICCQYAAARNILNRRGKEVEILVNYEPSCISIAEWWKQLFGESEGKEGKGLFPASLNFTTDLHSMGQFVQEGRKIIFETTLNIENRRDDMVVPFDDRDFDGLNYISGKPFSYINQKAFEGTFMAHSEGEVPGIIINVPEMNEYYLGKIFYFFMMSCAISGYTNNIDPFTQPGVEHYKKNMFSLLGKR
ncbi:glucose-6-phosphate isomerase [Sedimentibacter hydroxybenzoicus DSM 7310]|uniref:Glucose-6-phosphate isomerase n=1 Tax=Sedimentibacter hydroxybenzoicus DSM 7310 TaxID=1123245 RepID=A0A974GVT1_SEDHY|nr:glucose-6-phosphate isomerase [Sedimentibacter hydroxybenzoicus]NYB73704.1 glucose-6-phosphate isomerase [Sedimentibacter hydroxybenzoicus DSM 7310]